jgi:hypothetical protein
MSDFTHSKALEEYCARSAARNEPVRPVDFDRFDDGWVVRLENIDGTPASVRLIVANNGAITAYMATAPVELSIAQFYRRR